ncbi:cobalamin B12-binding domain-containing protein, partial [Deinococcus pimensis]|uniref:cobalamin B12-binding domain-containing protein n=1 Tax=Deinococcus pimensis TaxID=309888 RepID=UPI0005EB1A88
APAARHGTPESLVPDVVRALLQPDHVRAGELLSRAHAQLTVEDVLMHVVQPALREIGLLWERGEITVAHEHQATAFLRGRIAQLLEMAGPGGTWGPTIVAACGPGEQHELGLLMVAVVLRRAGVHVHYLGPNTPLGDLAVYARQVRAHALLVSVNTAEALAALTAQLHDLDDLGMPLFFGGSQFNERPERAAQLGGAYLGSDAVSGAQALVTRLKETHGYSS